MVRPASFDDFHGQPDVKANLQISTTAATRRKRIHGHTLYVGPPGVGKTTLAAYVMPGALGVDKADVTVLNCTAIQQPTDLLPSLTSFPRGGILFLDEIHCLSAEICEYLYHAMEDQQLTIIPGPDLPPMTVEIEEFTIVGATTREGLIPEPMRDRFKHIHRLELYDDEDMERVIAWTVGALAAVDEIPSWQPEAFHALVKPCHGTARFAGRLIEACHDTYYGSSEPYTRVDAALVNTTLNRLGFKAGLGKMEFKILEILEAGRAGLKTLAAALDEEPQTIEDVYEPWMLQMGYFQRGNTGRTITDAGRIILKVARDEI